MIIGIDLSPIENNPAGIGQYTLNLVKALLSLDKKNTYFLYFTKKNNNFPTSDKINNIIIKKKRLIPASGIFWIWQVVKHAKKSEVELFISPSNFLFARLFPNTIQFVYDIAPVLFPQYYSRKSAALYKLLLRNAVSRAKKICVISQTSKIDLIRFSKSFANKKDNIHVIYPSINQLLIDNAIEFVELPMPEEYLLYLGTLQPRKNITAIINGYARFLENNRESKLNLVIIGKKGWYFQGIFDLVEKLNLTSRIHFMGYIDDQYLKKIIENAKAMLYLSSYEGFGMPPLESLFLGTPVILSDIPVFKECFSESAILVNASQDQEVAEAIQSIISGNKKVSFNQKQFTWQKSANQLLQLYDRVSK